MRYKDSKDLPKNQRTAFQYFISKGLSPQASAGIVGNLMQESMLNPLAVGDKGTSFGIYQARNERKVAMQKAFPDSYNTLEGQLEFLWQELNTTHKKALDGLQKSATTEEATKVFQDKFEKPHPKYAQTDRRIRFANEILNNNIQQTVQETEQPVAQLYNSQPTPVSIPVEPAPQKQQDKDDPIKQSLENKISKYNLVQELFSQTPTTLPTLQENVPIQTQGFVDPYVELIGKQTLFQDGGRLNYENELMSQVTNQRNKEKDFVNRGLNPDSSPYIKNEDGSISTHRMAYSTDDFGRGIVYPTIVNDNGQLIQLNDEEAFNYAISNSQNNVLIPEENLAEYYTTQGLIKHTFQDGGQYQQDRDWLQNWYENRQIQNPEIQRAYLEDKPNYETLSSFIPDPLITDGLPDDIKGQYNPQTEEIWMVPNASQNTYLHEATHRTQDFNSTMRPIHNDLVNQNLLPQSQVSTPYQEDYNYYKDSDEIHARIQVLRREAGIQPTQTVTPEFIQNFFQNYKGSDGNIEDLKNLTNEQGLLNLLNNMAQNSNTPSQPFYGQNGGVIEDDRGQWAYPHQITKINSSNITMQGVNYPVLGIDDLGNTQLMQPNQNYTFKGSSVTEYPLSIEALLRNQI